MAAQPKIQTAMSVVAAEARRLYEAGILTFPGTKNAKHPDRGWPFPGDDGKTKPRWSAGYYPPIGWPIPEQHAAMFEQPEAERMFVVCGERSDNACCLDYDDEGYFELWAAQVPGELYDRLYIEQSQRSGGYHVGYRKVTRVGKSCVLARDPRQADGSDGKVRIEMRGEGAGFVAAPSIGYQRLQGDLAHLPVLTNEECRILEDAAATFNACEPRVLGARKPPPIRPDDADERPGDRYNRECSQGDVLDLFKKHGYAIGRSGNGNVDITRPGATSETSGNVSPEGITFMHSTNAEVEAGVGHPPFHIYATLEYGGNHSEAAKALSRIYNPPIRIKRSHPAIEAEADGTDSAISPTPIRPGIAEGDDNRRALPPRALTDLGNAERLIDRFGDSLHYSGALGWLIWNDKNWVADETGQVERFAKLTVRDTLREASDAEEHEQRKALSKWAIRSESASAIANLIQLARTEEGVPVRTDDLDTNPWLLTVANGTLDLRTGALGPHRRTDMITKASPVTYNPAATCPRWLEFLHRIMEGDEARVSYLQRAIGYSLTGDTSERAMFVLYGKGKNGKSTLLTVISELVGDFATRTPTETLMQKQTGGIPNDIAQLRGARFVFASEAEDGRRLAESLIKDLTGEDVISARFMRQEFFRFQPTFKIWFSTNHRPVIRGTDEAIWDRLKLIPFNYRFKDGEQRPKHEVLAEFRAEMPGILAWAVRGCLEWRNDGLGVSEAIHSATAEYRVDMDTLGAWIADECVESPLETEGSAALYEDYKRWAENGGERPLTNKAFSQRLVERGFTKKRVTKGYSFSGIRVKGRSDDESGAFQH